MTDGASSSGATMPVLERVNTALSNISARTPPPPRPPPVLSPRLVLQLSQQSAPLASIVREHELPRVVQCDGVTAPSVELPFNVYEPLMIYKKRRVRKVAARSVIFNKKLRELIETGGDILVPEDYPGWFVVLGSPNEIKTESHIPHFRIVCRLATSACRKFLVGGSTFIKGITKIPGGWQTCQIFPGDVLRKGGLYQARQELTEKERKKQEKKNKKSLIGRKKPSSSAEDRSGGNLLMATDMYLSCYDSREREIFLPGWQEGVFFILSQDGAPVKTPVLQMNDLLQRFKFPLVVKLLYGPVPKTLCAFNDTLLLTEAGMSHTVIASTLENIRNINLEIPLDNAMLFHLAEQNTSLMMSRQYQRALAECHAKVPSYERNIKVLIGADRDEDIAEPGRATEDSKPPSPVPQEAASEDTNYTGDRTPPMRRRGSSARPSLRTSRLSVISRVITVNTEDQNIFAPTVPPSSFSPTSPQTPISKQSSVKSKSHEDYSNTNLPEKLDLVQDFVPPEVPETIPATPPVRNISRDGEAKLNAFQKKSQERHEYETPNSLLEPSTESADSVEYGSIWQLESSHRDSAAGIKLANCKIGRATNLFLKPVPGQSALEENGRRPEYSSFISQNSLPGSLDSSTDGDIHNSTLAPGAVSDVQTPGSHRLCKPAQPTFYSGDSQENDHYQRPHDNPQPSSQNPCPEPHHSTLKGTYLLPHVYNDVVEGPQYQNQSPQKALSQSASTGTHSENSAGVQGEYITPLETGPFAIGEERSLPLSNPYAQPKDIWRVSGPNEEGCVFYELNGDGNDLPMLRVRNADSGIYEGEDTPALPPPEDHYDRPIVSAQVSFEPSSDHHSVYDKIIPTHTHSPTFTDRNPRQNLHEMTHKMSPPSSPHIDASKMNGAVKLPAMRPTQLDVQPPPLPDNHPVRSTIGLMSRIPLATSPVSPPTKSSKKILIHELKTEGLKPSSELAIKSLQIVDITMLVQKKNDIEENLMSLLPQVSKVDILKIALCIRRMGVKLAGE